MKITFFIIYNFLTITTILSMKMKKISEKYYENKKIEQFK
ncbi:hypothetical protein HMPREF9500_02530 [Enterococcus faecalis TX0017]|nr:hypothetical protein HMPREF9500_02530 [Enterococcus faecalis TX0017]